MPYIKEEERKTLDPLIDELVYKIRLSDKNKLTGRCNYTITRILLNALEPQNGWSYNDLNSVIGVLQCASNEIYRSLIAPYEDKAIKKNGDLHEFMYSAQHHESKEERYSDEQLVEIALTNGWEISNVCNIHILCPPFQDESIRWAAKYSEVQCRNMTVLVPHWLENRLKELKLI